MREKTNADYLYLTQRTQRTQNFQCKLRYRWSSRWLRATGERKGETETEPSTPSVATLLVPLSQRDSWLLLRERYHPLSPPETGGSTPQGGGGG